MVKLFGAGVWGITDGDAFFVFGWEQTTDASIDANWNVARLPDYLSPAPTRVIGMRQW